MPTTQDLSSLHNKCDWTWTTLNGVKGYVVRGRGDYASNSIFIPCAGHGRGTSRSNTDTGYFWSSVSSSSDYNAYVLFFVSDSRYTRNYYRFYGQSVRPVQGFAK